MRKAIALVALLLCSWSLSAQTLNLRDLLTNFLLEGIDLADPPAGSTFSSHKAHFISEDSLQPRFAPMFALDYSF